VQFIEGEPVKALSSSFQTVDGLTLSAHRYLPGEKPCAAVILVHGYAEHAGRYRALTETLVGSGFAVYTLDLRGHGESEGRRANVRVFNEYVHDLTRFMDLVREARTHTKRFLFGHSMGGLVALQAVLEHPEKVDGLVLSAPFVENATPVSPLLERAASLISSFAPDLPVQKLDVSALARDARVVQGYQDDPLVYQGKVKARIGYELLRTGGYLTGRAGSISLPVLVQHGAADRIAAPSGSRALFEVLGSSDKTLKLYDGAFHEIYNDLDRETVIADLLEWLRAHKKTNAPLG
jgi:acylglycerol lipase